MIDDNKPTFTTLGNSDDSAVCGPEGCNIQEHRNQEKKENQK